MMNVMNGLSSPFHTCWKLGMLHYRIRLMYEIMRKTPSKLPSAQDCGGASGFEEFLEALSPADPEHKAMAVW